MNQRTNKLAGLFVRNDSGQSMAEFALTVPLFIVLFLGILDLGRVVFIHSMLTAAAQDGARAGAVTANHTTITTAVQERLSAVDPIEVAIAIDRTDEYTQVEVAYTFMPVTPFISSLFDNAGIEIRRSARVQVVGVFIN